MKKMLSLVLCLIMVVSTIPMLTFTASAASWWYDYPDHVPGNCMRCYFAESEGIVGGHVFDNPSCKDADGLCNCCGSPARGMAGMCSWYADNDCNLTCSYCGEEYDGNRDNLPHVYDDPDDCGYCSNCGWNSESEHSYGTACDEKCSRCSHTRTPPHVYDNDCDTVCNSCSEERVAPHVYDNVCDAECNECDFVRTVAGHSYTDETDVDCNKCGYIAEDANAEYGKCGDNITWVLNKNTKVLTLKGTGATYDYTNLIDVNPFVEHRTSIDSIVIGGGITKLGNRLFKGLNHTASVVFGNDVKSMGYEVFYGCTALSDVKFNGKLTNIGALTFYNCTSLAQVTIPSTVTNLENRAFKGSGLTSIVVPDTVKKTGYEVFMNCAQLESVEYTQGVSMLNPCTFQNCVSLKEFYFTDNMCRIRSNAFNGCTSLEKITFENAKEMWGSSNGQEAKIASNAFEGCNDTLQMIAEEGSHVETYANNNGFTFVAK